MTKANGTVSTTDDLRPYMKLRDDILAIAKLDADQGAGFDVASRVIDEITKAETMEDIFAANEQGPIKAEDLVNIPLSPFDISWHKSAEKFATGGLGVYGVLSAYKDDGEEIVVSCGAPNLVASWRMMQLGGFINADDPQKGRHKITATDTPNGTLLRVGRP